MQITYENCLCCTFIRKILGENTQSIQLCKSSELWVKTYLVRNGVVEGKNCTELKWGGTSPFIVVS